MISAPAEQWIVEQALAGRKPTEIGRSVGLSRHQVRRILAKQRQEPIGMPPTLRLIGGSRTLSDTARKKLIEVQSQQNAELTEEFVGPGLYPSPGDTVWLRRGLYRGSPTLHPILFVPDAHIPYHHVPSWNLMIRAAQDLKPHTICVIGDLADFFGVSDHLKDPRRARRLEDEVAQVNAALDELDALGAVRKIFIEGNHEDRLKRYLEAKAPELFGFVDVPSLFNLRERGWEHVPYHEYTRIGKLFVTHDVGAAGKYAVYQTLATYEHSIVTGHTHRLAYIVEGNAVGEYKVATQFGWLGDVDQVDYLHRAKAKKDWALGFGVGRLDPATGYVYLSPVPIVNGTCVVEGQLYTTTKAAA